MASTLAPLLLYFLFLITVSEVIFKGKLAVQCVLIDVVKSLPIGKQLYPLFIMSIGFSIHFSEI